MRKKFGEKVYRISVDCGFTCPTRDGKLGTGGCLYCNNASFAPQHQNKIVPVKEQIAAGIERLYKYRKIKKFLVYFQAYTNTYAPIEKLRRLYFEAIDFPEVAGIIIGTRPDCIDDDILKLLQEISHKKDVSIEFGIESVYDKTLEWVNRGHNFKTTMQAIKKAKESGLHVGGHYILGFPTESRKEMLASAGIINNLGIDAIKIHQLHVVKNTELAKLYQKKPFPVFNEEQWIKLVCDFLEQLDPGIVIQRLVGDAKGDTLIAPQWKQSKIEVLQAIKNELKTRNSFQGKYRVR